jgi:hypothetical protein
MLGYDLTGRGCAINRSPRGKTDATEHAMCRLRHNYLVPVFNVLASI